MPTEICAAFCSAAPWRPVLSSVGALFRSSSLTVLLLFVICPLRALSWCGAVLLLVGVACLLLCRCVPPQTALRGAALRRHRRRLNRTSTTSGRKRNGRRRGRGINKNDKITVAKSGCERRTLWRSRDLALRMTQCKTIENKQNDSHSCSTPGPAPAPQTPTIDACACRKLASLLRRLRASPSLSPSAAFLLPAPPPPVAVAAAVDGTASRAPQRTATTIVVAPRAPAPQLIPARRCCTWLWACECQGGE